MGVRNRGNEGGKEKGRERGERERGGWEGEREKACTRFEVVMSHINLESEGQKL